MTGATARGLCEFIDASPSPFHVCATVADRLRAADYTELDETERWDNAAAGRFFTVRAGSLIAWQSGITPNPTPMPFRIIGAHTDSPNLRVKQHPDRIETMWRLVRLQPYGGAWLNSWLDRDLGLCGRISLLGKDGRIVHRLVRFDEPLLRVPQLAIHLAEERNSVSLNPQRHLDAVFGAEGPARPFHYYVADWAGVAQADLLSADLMTHDLTPSRVIGVDKDLISAPRLDNQASCYAGLEALLAAEPGDYLPVLALFDHEEVGSVSDHGAQSDLLRTTLERIVLTSGGDREDFLRLTTASMVASADMAHATHPNYPERHEPGHPIYVNAGPVLKVQPNLRYATDSRTAAAFELACRQAGVPLQRYEHRADLPCGSTIGPMTAARTGIPTVDVGAPQLAMHSARELMGVADVGAYAAALRAFLAPE
jgi:aspartyl aminopeptidase